MAKIKSFTDLSQSKTLSKLLPLESADMEYVFFKGDNVAIGNAPFVKDDSEVEDSAYSHTYDRIACWSLAALLGVLEHPRCFQGDKPIYWFCGCFGKDNLYHEVEADNPVDACVAMIERLHELKML